MILSSNGWLPFSLVTLVDHKHGGIGYSAEFSPIVDYKMLKRRSQSTDITPLVNSAVEKLQELGTAYKMA